MTDASQVRTFLAGTTVDTEQVPIQFSISFIAICGRFILTVATSIERIFSSTKMLHIRVFRVALSTSIAQVKARGIVSTICHGLLLTILSNWASITTYGVSMLSFCLFVGGRCTMYRIEPPCHRHLPPCHNCNTTVHCHTCQSIPKRTLLHD